MVSLRMQCAKIINYATTLARSAHQAASNRQGNILLRRNETFLRRRAGVTTISECAERTYEHDADE